MRRGSTPVPLVAEPDRSSAVPLHRQLYEGLRWDILAGRLASGVRLPSTRMLASELGVSRNTVIGAYLQLLAEGYVEGRVGAGTFVAEALPEDLLRVGSGEGRQPRRASSGRGLSRRGELLAGTPATAAPDRGAPRAFRVGVPDEFPGRVWVRLAGRVWRRPPRELLGYGDPAGYRPLREEISAYVGAARGVRCSWEQVIVVSGSQQALDLTARLLLDPGDAA